MTTADKLEAAVRVMRVGFDSSGWATVGIWFENGPESGGHTWYVPEVQGEWLRSRIGKTIIIRAEDL